jgi:hypothetical protein
LQGAINARSQAAPCLWRSRISGSTERFCCDWQDNFKSSSSCHSISGNTLFLSVAPALWASGILVGAASDLCAVDSCKVSQGPARLPLQDPFKPFRCCFSLVSSLDPQRIPTRAALRLQVSTCSQPSSSSRYADELGLTHRRLLHIRHYPSLLANVTRCADSGEVGLVPEEPGRLGHGGKHSRATPPHNRRRLPVAHCTVSPPWSVPEPPVPGHW